MSSRDDTTEGTVQRPKISEVHKMNHDRLRTEPKIPQRITLKLDVITHKSDSRFVSPKPRAPENMNGHKVGSAKAKPNLRLVQTPYHARAKIVGIMSELTRRKRRNYEYGTKKRWENKGSRRKKKKW